MKTTLLAALLPFIATSLHSEYPDRGYRDYRAGEHGVQTGRAYSIDRDGYTRGSTYIITTDRPNGCGLGVSTGDDGRRSTYLVTPNITVETSRSK